ncbi:uncharacterized protein LOC104422085 [Eucalyptus grandis]|nr:uncharacterized protein LOC104422085 [Eucalyptus grandis]
MPPSQSKQRKIICSSNSFKRCAFVLVLLIQISLSLSLSLWEIPAKFRSGSLRARTKQNMKMMMNSTSSSATVGDSKRSKASCRRLGGYLKEQKSRIYIIRRCVVMLLCWHD